MTPSSPHRSNTVTDSTTLFEFKPGKHISVAALRTLLPDVDTALFFAKVYELDYHQLGSLLQHVFGTSDVLAALLDGAHSTELQDYLVDTIPTDLAGEFTGLVYDPDAAPPAQVLPQLWASLEVQVAQSIKEVAAKLADTLEMLPGKEGKMLFAHMAKLNKQRPTVGTYGAHIHHAPQVDNLVVLDVSGSMTQGTVRTIIDDVVALAWSANAHLAIVSNSTFHWEPGAYNSTDVLREAEFGGTRYETLLPLLHRTWGTVITIADYDSAFAARQTIKDRARGSIDTVLDISLVNTPTYLSQCLGELAREVRPLLIGSSHYVLS